MVKISWQVSFEFNFGKVKKKKKKNECEEFPSWLSGNSSD